MCKRFQTGYIYVILKVILMGMPITVCAQARSHSAVDTLTGITQPDPGIAQVLSAIGTLAPIGAGAIWLVHTEAKDGSGWIPVVSGVVFGPVVGYIYGGEALRGIGHAGIRVAALGVSYGVLALFGGISAEGESGGGGAGVSLAAVLGGTGFVVVYSLVDIVNVGAVVREQNESSRKIGISMYPTYSFRNRSAGISLHLSL
jgi:hypothetical protein